jgi:hypothetical protein
LQYVGPKEGSAHRYIVKMQKSRSIGQYGIDIDIFDIRHVSHDFILELVFPQVQKLSRLQGTVLLCHGVVFELDLIKGISELPAELACTE